MLFCRILLGDNIGDGIDDNFNFQTSQAPQARLLYIKQEARIGGQNGGQNEQNNEQNYVGQIISVKYNIIALADSSIHSIGFLDSPNSNVSLKNPQSSWNELPDGSLENTFYFKINASNFFIPQLEVIANKDGINESETSEMIRGNAIALGKNHPKYIGVVAQNLNISHYSVKFYDNNHNIIILDLNAEYSNLEDFAIKGIKEQGFESSNINIIQSNAIYYAVIPNNTLDIELEYFELPSQTYKMLHIKNIINKQQISVNQDINPINKVLIFQNIIIFIIICVLIALLFVKKIPFKLRLFGLIVAICLLIYLILSFNFKRDAMILKDTYLTILPTKNSTIIAKIPQNSQVEILNSHSHYYKIITHDGKIGWVKKDEVR